MTNFDDKYGIVENQAVKNYHKNRRMFAIKDGAVLIADEGVDYSHAEWFKKIGLANEANTDPINMYVRGTLETDGLYFYRGYDFQVDEESKDQLMSHLEELVNILNISSTSHVYGGKIIEVPGERAKPRKDYGTVGSLLTEQ